MRSRKNSKKETVTDALTGLFNRRSLYDQFSAIEKGEAPRPSGMFMIDLDRFKAINDSEGHIAGDHCLSALGAFIIEKGENSKMVGYRYGGEEFVCLVYGIENRELDDLADSVRKDLEVLAVDGRIHFTISLGYTSAKLEGASPMETWLDHSDQSVYKAKENGRNRIEIYSK